MEFKLGKERGAGDRIDDLKVLVISQGRCGGLLGVSWRDLRSESSVFEIEITGGMAVIYSDDVNDMAKDMRG